MVSNDTILQYRPDQYNVENKKVFRWKTAKYSKYSENMKVFGGLGDNWTEIVPFYAILNHKTTYFMGADKLKTLAINLQLC